MRCFIERRHAGVRDRAVEDDYARRHGLLDGEGEEEALVDVEAEFLAVLEEER